jgi:hypothetical protein
MKPSVATRIYVAVLVAALVLIAWGWLDAGHRRPLFLTGFALLALGYAVERVLSRRADEVDRRVPAMRQWTPAATVVLNEGLLFSHALRLTDPVRIVLPAGRYAVEVEEFIKGVRYVAAVRVRAEAAVDMAAGSPAARHLINVDTGFMIVLFEPSIREPEKVFKDAQRELIDRPAGRPDFSVVPRGGQPHAIVMGAGLGDGQYDIEVLRHGQAVQVTCRFLQDTDEI